MTAVAYVLLYRSVVLVGSARVAIAMMVELVATVIFAAIVLDEEITARVGWERRSCWRRCPSSP